MKWRIELWIVLFYFNFRIADLLFYAFDTLEELGYEVMIEPSLAQPEVKVHIAQCDVTSALEIAQVCGGQMIQEQ